MATDVTSASVSSRPRKAWRAASLAFALSLLFPGSGQLFTGSISRACLWSAAYLAFVLPGSIFLYVGLSSPGSGVYLGVAAFLLAFLLLGSVGPVRKSLWGPTDSRPRRPLWLLESYAAVVALMVTLEVEWFLRNCFATKSVETSCLAPFVAPGDRLTVLLSSYVRPVHGDLLLLFRNPLEPGAVSAGTNPLELSKLGLVLARAGDTIRSANGKLIVNGLELNLARSDQRFDLERAGRTERRRRFFAPLRLAGKAAGANPAELPRAVLDGSLPWGTAEWGPHVVPRGLCFMLLDAGDCVADPIGHQGVFVQKAYIAGRAID